MLLLHCFQHCFHDISEKLVSCFHNAKFISLVSDDTFNARSYPRIIRTHGFAMVNRHFSSWSYSGARSCIFSDSKLPAAVALVTQRRRNSLASCTPGRSKFMCAEPQGRTGAGWDANLVSWCLLLLDIPSEPHSVDVGQSL